MLKFLRRLLLGVSVVISIVSIFPGCRFAGNIALRALALLSNLLLFPEQMLSWEDRLSIVAKAGIVILGIVGVVLGMIPLLLASMIADVVFHVLELKRHLFNWPVGEEGIVLIRLGFLVVEILAIMSVALGAWMPLIFAAFFNIVCMFGLAALRAPENINHPDFNGRVFESFCYGILSALSVAHFFNAIFSLGDDAYIEYRFKGNSIEARNNTAFEKVIYDKNGSVIGTLAPHETATFEVNRSDILYDDGANVWGMDSDGKLSYHHVPGKGYYAEDANGAAVVVKMRNVYSETYIPEVPCAPVENIPLLTSFTTAATGIDMDLLDAQYESCRVVERRQSLQAS